MRTHKSICVGVNMTISNLILRDGKIPGSEIHSHYHVTFHKIGGGKILTVYLICTLIACCYGVARFIVQNKQATTLWSGSRDLYRV